MKFKRTLLLGVCSALLLLPLASSAAIYIEYPGIDGFVTAPGYENQHEISSLQWAIGRAISMEAGALLNREASRPSFSEITLTRQTDAASAHFFREAVAGTAGKKVIIHFVRTGADKIVEYMRIELDNVLISSLSQSADSDWAPQESISLSYTKITFITIGAGPGGTTTVTYDLATAKLL